MPRPQISDRDIDHAVELYESGQTVKEVAAALSRHPDVVSGHLRRRGIKPSRARGARRERVTVPGDEIASRYLAGESELALSRAYGVSRLVIRKRLVDRSVAIRPPREANRLTVERMSPEEVMAKLAAAHAASKGRTATMREKSARALTYEGMGWDSGYVSDNERALAALIGNRVEIVPQKAVGPYNIDLAIGAVAVEVLGGSWHRYRKNHRERSRYLFDAGWHLLFVWAVEECPLGEGAANYVVAFTEQARRNPSAVREYRVIDGEGQEVARGRADGDELTSIPPPSRRKR